MRHSKKGLTDGELRKVAAPRKGARKVSAGGVPGLLYRVRSSGRREFLLRYTTAAGVTREQALGPHGARPPALTAERARERAREIRGDVKKGADPVAARLAVRAATAAARAGEREIARARAAVARGEPLPGSFAALARLFLADPARASQRPESRRAFVSRIERELIPAWGDRPAGEIARGDVYTLGAAIASGEGTQRRRRGKPAPAAAANVVKLASAVFNFGLDVGFPGLVGNPCARVLRRIAPPRAARDRWLSPAEIRALWLTTEEELPALRAFARLLLLSALRRDELLGARWCELEKDERGAWLAIPGERMKSGNAHRAPLSSLALEELERLRAAGVDGAGFVFPGRSAGRPLREVYFFRRRLQERMTGALAQAGTETDHRPWTWHDLRRTARSILAAEGVQETAAELLLAHVPPALRGVAGAYNRHDYAAEKQAAAEVLARRVRAIVSGGDGGNVLPFFPRAEGSPGR